MNSIFNSLRQFFSQEEATIEVPRWVVYFQAILLGVLSLSCFLFGLAAAQLSRPTPSGNASVTPCEVHGQVRISDQADAGAVVALLPLDARLDERVDPATLHPDHFEPLENPGIARLAEIGGAIRRTDHQGRFWLTVDGPRQFLLIAISKNQARNRETSLSREDTAALAKFFLPIESLYSGKAIRVRTVNITANSFDAGQIEFE